MAAYSLEEFASALADGASLGSFSLGGQRALALQQRLGLDVNAF